MIEHYPAAAGDVSRFFLGDELLLFSTVGRHLFRLNSSSAYIWCCLEEGLTHEEISGRLAGAFRIRQSEAARDVREMLARWSEAGLLACRPRRTPVEALPSPSAGRPIQRGRPLLSGRFRWYHLAGRSCRIVYPDPETEGMIHPVISHLERTPPEEACAGSIEIERRGASGFVVSMEESEADRCEALSELAPLVHGNLLLFSLDAPGCLAVLHAAAVSDGGRCLLLPGDSGSGKSTLAAAMVGAGFTFFSDEVALLTPSPCRVLPVPLSFSLKEGSWQVLARFFPELQQLPVHRRPDGKRVRYLAPPADELPGNVSAGLPAAGIVFPRYLPGRPVDILPLSAAEALCRIAEGGYDFSGRIDADSIGEIVSWISEIPCFELVYDDLSRAVSALRGLL